MKRYYSDQQRQKACEMELRCKSDFEQRGITPVNYGNCVECYCTAGCGECIDDQFCKPDYSIPDIKVKVEVTGHNPKDPEAKPGLRLEWPLCLTKCKTENFLARHSSGETDLEYIYHYANITAVDHTGDGRLVTLLNDHIRIIRLDQDFIDTYRNGEFEIRTIGQDVMVCIPPNSRFVITPKQMYEEIALKRIANNPGWG